MYQLGGGGGGGGRLARARPGAGRHPPGLKPSDRVGLGDRWAGIAVGCAWEGARTRRRLPERWRRRRAGQGWTGQGGAGQGRAGQGGRVGGAGAPVATRGTAQRNAGVALPHRVADIYVSPVAVAAQPATARDRQRPPATARARQSPPETARGRGAHGDAWWLAGKIIVFADSEAAP